MEPNINRLHDLLTLRQLAEVPRFRNVFSEPKLRSLIAAAKPRLSARGGVIPPNGLLESGAVIQIGRRILIDVRLFEGWLEAKRLRAAGGPASSDFLP
jgi:hypothetical protein